MRPPALLLLAGLAAAQDNVPPSFSVPALVAGSEGQPIVITVSDVRPGPAEEYGQEVAVGATFNSVTWAVDGASGWYTPFLLRSVVRASAVGVYPAVWTITLDPVTWGSYPLLVSADDGVDLYSRLVTIDIAHVNNPPDLGIAKLQVPDGGTLLLDEHNLPIIDADAVPLPQHPVADVWSFILHSLPSHGELRLDGRPLAAGDAFTQEELRYGHLTYRHAGDGAGDSFQVRYTDGVIPAPAGPSWVNVEIVAAPIAPRILPSSSAVSWREGDAPTPLLPGGVVGDADTAVLAGGQVNASLSSGIAGDVLALAEREGITVAGTTVWYAGVAIGAWRGGTDGSPLVINLEGEGATVTAVQALLRALVFTHVGRDPGAARRWVSITVSDGSAGPSNLASVSVAVAPVDDPPLPVPMRISTVLGVERTIDLVAVDPDSAVVSWTITAQPANARVVLLDALAGRVRIMPAASGVGVLVLEVEDGVNPPVPVECPVQVTGPDDARPHAAGVPPHDAYDGEGVEMDIPWDVRDLPAGAVLDLIAIGDSPADLRWEPLSATRFRIAFTASPGGGGDGHRRFGLFSIDQSSGAAALLPVCLRIRPRPAGVR